MENRIVSNQLTSLAIIKVNAEENNDYIENFVPFVTECLRLSPKSAVSLPELQQAVLNNFGLNIPQGALKVILTRVKRKGYIKISHGVYEKIDSELNKLSFAKMRGAVLRQQQALVAKIIKYIKEQFQEDWSEENAELALLDIFSEYSADILAASIDGQPVQFNYQLNQKIKYQIYSFINHTVETDPTGFEYLETLVKGSMLANALLYPDLSSVTQKLERVEFYLDTKLLLRALGFSGPSLQAPVKELLSLIYQTNGNLNCFDFTLGEIQSVLDYCIVVVQNPQTSTPAETAEYFLTSGRNKSDIELIIATLENRLDTLRVKVKSKPPYVERLGIDELGLNNYLQEGVRYNNEAARHHDVDAIAAIHRLRGGDHTRRLESCQAVFVTTNTPLVRHSTHFLLNESEAVFVPPLLSDHVLTTLIWLKNPNSARNLPRLKVIADCYAALNPSDVLWRRYLTEINRLIENEDVTSEDYHLLRYSTEARKLLMATTCGDPNVFTEGTPWEVLEKTKANIRAETESRLEKEKTDKERIEKELGSELDKFKKQEEDRKQRIHFYSMRAGSMISKALILVMAALLIIGMYYTFPETPLPRSECGRAAVFLLLFIVSVLALGNVIWGTTIVGIVRGLEVRTVNKLEELISRLFEGNRDPTEG